MNNNSVLFKIVFCMQKKQFLGHESYITTREIADELGMTIYQVRGYLEQLRDTCVIEKVNSGKGIPGQWRLL